METDETTQIQIFPHFLPKGVQVILVADPTTRPQFYTVSLAFFDESLPPTRISGCQTQYLHCVSRHEGSDPSPRIRVETYPEENATEVEIVPTNRAAYCTLRIADGLETLNGRLAHTLLLEEGGQMLFVVAEDRTSEHSLLQVLSIVRTYKNERLVATASRRDVAKGCLSLLNKLRTIARRAIDTDPDLPVPLSMNDQEALLGAPGMLELLNQRLDLDAEDIRQTTQIFRTADLGLDDPEVRLALLRKCLPKDDVRDLMPAANRRHSSIPPGFGKS